MSGHDRDDEFQWSGRDYFEVDLPTLLAMPVPAAAHQPEPPTAAAAMTPEEIAASLPRTTELAAQMAARSAAGDIEALADPEATRLFTPRPSPMSAPTRAAASKACAKCGGPFAWPDSFKNGPIPIPAHIVDKAIYCPTCDAKFCIKCVRGKCPQCGGGNYTYVTP